MYHRHRLPIVVNMGSGLGQSFFLAVTLSSGQVEWSPRRAVILSKFTVVSSFEEWSVLEVDAGQTFLRVIHSLQGAL
jgi:hypothetical protein